MYGPENPLLETMIMAIQVDFELRSKNQERTSIILGKWKSHVPYGVALGQNLHEKGLLNQMRESGVEAGEMINTLCRLAVDTSQK